MSLSPEKCRESVAELQFFKQRYENMQRWALHITAFDRELSEDLIHDICLKLLHRPAETEPRNPEAYLFKAIKNAYLSEIRRKNAAAEVPLLTIVGDLETLRLDPLNAIKIEDQLRAVCEFACRRKNASIAASILLLRFFHGYYSSEVARLINRSVNAVEARLRAARRDVMRHRGQNAPPSSPKRPKKRRSPVQAEGQRDLLAELRESIFDHRSGPCLTPASWRRLYYSGKKPISRETIAHFVSCRKCLSRINELLGLPALAERHPIDTLRLPKREDPVIELRAKAARAGSKSGFD